MSFDHAAICVWGFCHPCNFLLLSRNSWLKHLCVLFNNCLIRFAFALSASEVHVVKKWCRFVNIHVFRHSLPHWSQILLLSSHLDVITQKLTGLVHDERTYTPSSEYSPIHVLMKLARILFPIAIPPMDDRTNFVQDVRLGLQFSTMILAFGVVEDVSKLLDISDFGIWRNLGASSNFTWVLADTASAAVLRNLAILQ